MLKQYTILLIFCLCAAHSAATSLSLRDCMEYAIAHSAKMEIQRANNDDAHIARREAILRAEAEYRQTLREVEAEMARAVQDRDGAMAALKQADRRAKAQQEAYAINSKKFEQGLISPLELKTSSDNHLNAQAEHLNAQLKYFIKSCVVRYYNGEKYIEQVK